MLCHCDYNNDGRALDSTQYTHFWLFNAINTKFLQFSGYLKQMINVYPFTAGHLVVIFVWILNHKLKISLLIRHDIPLIPPAFVTSKKINLHTECLTRGKKNTSYSPVYVGALNPPHGSATDRQTPRKCSLSLLINSEAARYTDHCAILKNISQSPHSDHVVGCITETWGQSYKIHSHENMRTYDSSQMSWLINSLITRFIFESICCVREDQL